ncbi:MAG: tRNA 2-thiouridine(34) synthase MnmA [bacterium]|nr:tRNA 2-thiouridine(34) synthase MnmA [bacterium]
MTKKLKIAVAMSGGVDSSVAAQLLKNQGHEVIGIFLHFWKEQEFSGKFENKCCSTEALIDARRVADIIGIPLYTLNFSKIFKKQVVDNFLSEYAAGRTPNPCVVCNKRVKLGELIRRVGEIGFDYVASGHYVKKSGNKLYKAKDQDKDQSYFLYTFTPGELKHLLFPLGDYTKDQVRAMAKKYKLPVAEKSDSQEICFIAEKSHNEFLKRHLKLKPGLIKTIDGKTVGRHAGLPLYTIGQRKGIEIGGTGPYYAVKMDYRKNILRAVNERDHESLYKKSFTLKKVNWTVPLPKLPVLCQAVIRYRHKPVACRVSRRGKQYAVELKTPQRAITPGQSAVFYRGRQVLGGGVIA